MRYQQQNTLDKYKDLKLKLLDFIFISNNTTVVYKNCILAIGELSILSRDNRTNLNNMAIEQDLLNIKYSSILEFYGVLELLKHDTLTIKNLLDEGNEPGVIYKSFKIFIV